MFVFVRVCFAVHGVGLGLEWETRFHRGVSDHIQGGESRAGGQTGEEETHKHTLMTNLCSFIYSALHDMKKYGILFFHFTIQ